MLKKKANGKNLKGMTLAEVIIAIGILVTGFIMSYTAFSQSGRYLQRGIDFNDLNDTADVMLAKACSMYKSGGTDSEIRDMLSNEFDKDASGREIEYVYTRSEGKVDLNNGVQNTGVYITVSVTGEDPMISYSNSGMKKTTVTRTQFVPDYDVSSGEE